jgi:flagellar protein FlaJ
VADRKISAELLEAKQRLYKKADKSKVMRMAGAALGMMFLMMGFLQVANPHAFNFTFKPLVLNDTNQDGNIDSKDVNDGYDLDGDGVPDQSEAPIKRLLNFMVFAMLSFIGPYGFYTARQQREIRQIEKRLPDFLRDVAEAGRFGMTLSEAIVVAAQGRYGKLTPEIKRMAAQIEWGVPTTEALRLFSERVKTPMVERVVAIIIKASHAGGDVADVLTMVSHDAKEYQLTQEERKINMSTYIAVIYISFFVFIVTIFILGATFLPKIKEASASITGGDPSALAASPLPQDIISVIFNIQLAFFIAVIVHAVGDGILAGVLDNGKVANGLRHSFIMLVIAVVGFQFL